MFTSHRNRPLETQDKRVEAACQGVQRATSCLWLKISRKQKLAVQTGARVCCFSPPHKTLRRIPGSVCRVPSSAAVTTPPAAARQPPPAHQPPPAMHTVPTLTRSLASISRDGVKDHLQNRGHNIYTCEEVQ